MADDYLDKIERTVGTFAKVIEVTKDSAEAKQAASNLGRVAVTLTSALDNCLLPIAAFNYGVVKFKKYFEEKFQDDLAEKIADIPNENLMEPKASIAGPVLQGLAFTHEEQGLKSMYLGLLASAMDSRVAEDSHPAFVEIIKQLNAREAELLSVALSGNYAPIADVRVVAEDGGWKNGINYLLNFYDTETGEMYEEPRIETMITNLLRLGLIEVDFNNHLEGQYAWVKDRPEVIKLKIKYNHKSFRVDIRGGILAATALGLQFAKAVGIADPQGLPQDHS